LARQDIEQGRGFICSALHSDTTPYLLGVIAEEEARLSEDLSDRLILIEPADPEFSVGLNILEQQGGRHNFVQIAEVHPDPQAALRDLFLRAAYRGTAAQCPAAPRGQQPYVA